MEVDVKREVAAVVTLHPEYIAGGAPTFIARDTEQMQQWASSLASMLQGIAHELSDGLLIVIKH